MKKYDRIAALVLILLGAAVAVYAYSHLGLGTLRRPESGMVPFAAALVVIFCSGGWLTELRGRDENPVPFWGKGEWIRPLLALIFLVLYALSMETVGYLLSTLLFLGAWQFLIERQPWRRATVITLLGAFGMYLLFVYLLGVPVPQPIWS
ncbi:MAG: tripartite tricarboxylate transporter TctB family protein [Bacillota bacterium]